MIGGFSIPSENVRALDRMVAGAKSRFCSGRGNPGEWELKAKRTITPDPWKRSKNRRFSGEARSRETLRVNNTRIVTYDGLIDNTRKAYQDYVDRGEEAGRVYRLIQEISEPDAQAINPT